ncbi:ribonuclease H-like domain-containing protein [Flammula alnicola]|nr:ribonuclease H-like domain-containing protein [Flammula alnicola]KAF8964927.1 ribonuclease H-like domain-containing protein [Flammula alnicola]
MPPTKNPIWDHFLASEKQNAAHIRAHCRGCIEKCRPAGSIVELDDEGNSKLSSESWVVEACKADVGGVLGVKASMVAHILGGKNPCPNASSAARKTAKAVKKGKGKRERDDSSSESDNQSTKKPAKKKLLTKVETSMKQSHLKVFRGIQVPFTSEQEEIVREQFLRATISANLPFRWVEDPEVMVLFLLFRSTAGDVMPSRKEIAGQLLDNADTALMKWLKIALRGGYAVMASDGWKDESRNAVNGVNLSVGGKTYLIDLILATAHKKDGASMCTAFEGMIDRAEDAYGVVIVAFCCDNDGGSQRGRKDLVLKRPWLFGPPCCAHQFQLILGEYFTVNKEAAETAEEATSVIGWILNHGRVRSVFDEMQAEISVPPGKVLAYLAANMTRWTTHFVAFDRLDNVKDPLRRTVISRKQDLISAQVGAEKNRQKKQKLEDEAVAHCEIIDDGGFWHRLKSVVDDLEPICLGLNMNQTDAMRPDQALLTFAGIFLYFQKHSKPEVAVGMTTRIEKRWKALDQPMFVLALVLNPFEGVSRFGDKAAVSPFTLNMILLETYHRVCSRPPKVPRSEDEKQVYDVLQLTNEREVSESFLSYLSGTGVFEDWEKNKEIFQRVNGDNPITMWKAFLRTPATAELANFAILLLSMSVNQAGLERSFSDLKIKKTRLRNRLKLTKLEKMAKVGADIRTSQKAAGLVEDRAKRQNHEKARVAELLAVPRYADLLEDAGETAEDEEPSKCPSGLVKSREGWRKEMAKWVQEEQERSDDDNDELANRVYGHKRSKWLPRSLDLLFAGRKETDIDQQMRRIRRQQAYMEEARLMELLVDEEADEERIPDDGELEGSGDDFDG